jgi:hypothetical protein
MSHGSADRARPERRAACKRRESGHRKGQGNAPATGRRGERGEHGRAGAMEREEPPPMTRCGRTTGEKFPRASSGKRATATRTAATASGLFGGGAFAAGGMTAGRIFLRQPPLSQRREPGRRRPVGHDRWGSRRLGGNTVAKRVAPPSRWKRRDRAENLHSNRLRTEVRLAAIAVSTSRRRRESSRPIPSSPFRSGELPVRRTGRQASLRAQRFRNGDLLSLVWSASQASSWRPPSNRAQRLAAGAPVHALSVGGCAGPNVTGLRRSSSSRCRWGRRAVRPADRSSRS